MNKNVKHEPRTRGTKPTDPRARAARVGAAVTELEKIGAAFTVADVAEKAGVSRATIYRDHSLRALVGARGDGIRPVDPTHHARVCARHQSLQVKARDLRRQLADAEQGWDEMRDRALKAERQLTAAERRIHLLTQHLASQGNDGAPVSLARLAAEIGVEGMRRARRQLALALHPDLFANDPEVAIIAGELMRALNEGVT